MRLLIVRWPHFDTSNNVFHAREENEFGTNLVFDRAQVPQLTSTEHALCSVWVQQEASAISTPVFCEAALALPHCLRIVRSRCLFAFIDTIAHVIKAVIYT